MNNQAAGRRQIPLAFANYQQFDFDSFLLTPQTLLLEQLKAIAKQDVVHHLYLWGERGTGKSHLLQAACKLASETHAQVAFVPLVNIKQFSPAMLHDLGKLDLVCIDDLDHLSGQEEWQQAVVWLYNELRDNGHSLIISGSTVPKQIKLELNDLRSRLEWDQVARLSAPDENTVREILKQKANARAFHLGTEVIDFLLKRVNRDLTSLVEILDQIDTASLVAKRKITIPFIKETLNQL